MNYTKNIFIICLLAISFNAVQAKNFIDMKGKWAFSTDSTDSGIKGNWFLKDFAGQITLPGSMAENNIGDEITAATRWTATNWSDSSWYKRPDFAKYRQAGNVKVSFWLSPQKVYVGPAWYQKIVNIPANWKNNDLFLELERCHWETMVWIDNQPIGMNNSLSTPHRYKLPANLKKGKHKITIRIDNRIKDINPGLDAHSISDNTQTNWNGIVGIIALKAVNKVAVQSIKVTPNLTKKLAVLDIEIVNNTNSKQSRKLNISAKSFNSTVNHKVPTYNKVVELIPGKNQVQLNLDMGDNFQTWDEFSPALYSLKVDIEKEKESCKTVTFGMRDLKTVGTQFQINNKTIFLRGTLECAIFPKTGYPPTDINSWKKIMQQMQNHGLNHIRFHSWCPPKAAFDAADEMGMYLQIENDAWATIGDGKAIDQYVYDESNRIVVEYGNHPSFCLMAYGNEPHGEKHKEYLSKFVDYWKKKDSRRIYTSAAGWPEIAENEYHNIPAPRIQQWNAGLKSIINSKAPQTTFDYANVISKRPIPVVSHEIGQWCVFPNFDEIKKYTGVLKAKNFELFQEDLADHHMADQAHDFLMASGKLQALCYKSDIEAALRTKGMGGFQLLDLHDFPGQGTALVGVLDAFWEEKGYITPAEFSQFCNKVVPLARITKMVLSTADTLQAKLEIANFSGETLKNSLVKWEITDSNNKIIQTGNTDIKDYPVGNGLVAGAIDFPLTKIQSPAQYKLRVWIDGTKYNNKWDFWVYNKQLNDNQGDIYMTNILDQKAIDLLENGKNVLLTVSRKDLKPEKGGNIDFGFSTVFWNTSWTKNQAPQTLGILCKPEHPALANFPTEFHTNWQWWDIITHSGAMNIDDFPAEFKPIVQPIDTWFDNRKLALVMEAKVLNGKLIVASVDLMGDLSQRLPSRQLKYSLLEYMKGDKFNPSFKLEVKDIQNILK